MKRIPKACPACGQKHIEVRRTAIKTQTYTSGKRVGGIDHYILAETTLYCFECGHEDDI
jgi:hypothetical protein